MLDELTFVALSYRKNRHNYRILFGETAHELRFDWKRRGVLFKPGNLFAYERWEGGKYGTTHWSIHVAQAVKPGGFVMQIPGIFPGGDLVGTLSGKDACKRFLLALDDVRARGIPSELTSDDWLLIVSRIQANMPARPVIERAFARCEYATD